MQKPDMANVPYSKIGDR